jgi:hypothetical protein
MVGARAEGRLALRETEKGRAAVAQTENGLRGRVGDLVVVEGRRVGQGRRIGEILEVLGESGHEHYRVRWEADRESVFYPSSDATIQHAKPRKKIR